MLTSILDFQKCQTPVFIYDARVLTKKWFGFGDQNEASLGFKIIGFIVAITGALLVFFNI